MEFLLNYLFDLDDNNVISKYPRYIDLYQRRFSKEEIDTDEFIDRLIENLYEDYSMDEYRSKNIVLGKEIKVIEGEKTYYAKAAGIADNGNLILSDGRILSYGEVSIR